MPSDPDTNPMLSQIEDLDIEDEQGLIEAFKIIDGVAATAESKAEAAAQADAAGRPLPESDPDAPEPDPEDTSKAKALLLKKYIKALIGLEAFPDTPGAVF